MGESDTGTSAVVVGGSRGLGRAVAQALHEAGAHVVSLSRSPQPTAAPWVQESVDATDEDQVNRFFAERFQASPTRNVLVNFAGTRYKAPLMESDVAQWRECFDSSLLATYLMLRGFARAVEGRPGAVINMSSLHAAGAAPGRSAYASAKAAVVQLTAVAAVELAPTIRVNCIEPGFIATQASIDMMGDGRLDGDAIADRTPMGRWGREDDITAAVMFLLSDASRFVTGETLRVDGAWLRHMAV